MHRSVPAALCACFLLTGPAPAQTTGPLLDILKVKVRPDKVMEYEAAIKRLVEANRKGGDQWVAFSTEYGDSGTIYFSSLREKMADIETGYANFEKAGKEAFGAGYPKFMADLMAMSESATAELRRRRWDLSVNAPATREEQMKLAASARWIRSLRIEVRQGRGLDFVEAWKPWQAELATVGPKLSLWASQVITGTTAFTFASYFKSLSEADELDAIVPKLFGAQAYKDFLKSVADTTVKSAWEIHRMRPELSCVPDEFAAADPDFWRPKASPTATRMKRDKGAKKP